MKTQIHVDHTMYASGNKRFANYLIDSFVYYIIIFIIGAFTGLLAYFEIDGPLLWIESMGPVQEIIFNYGMMILYFVFIEGLTQRSVGKLITGTKVVMEDGSRPDAKTILIRSLCRLIPFEQFSFLGSTHVGWHDSISKTYVVDIKKYNEEVARRTSLDEIGQAEQY